MVTANKSPERSSRRRVRVHCSVTVGDRTRDGFTRNLSESGVYLLLPPDDSEQLGVGCAVRLRIELPDGSLVDCPAEIAWVDVNDRDVDGSHAVGIGAELRLADARHGDQLREFVHKFRYVVVVAGGTDAERGRITTSLSQEYDVVTARDGADVFYCLDHREVAVLILAPAAGISAVELLAAISARYPRSHAVRIVLSSTSTVDELRALINHGEIFRSLDVDLEIQTLLAAARAAADRYALGAENERMAGELERTKRWLERENAFLRQRLTGVDGFDKIIGKSEQLRDALRQLERIRRTHVPVHIHGETGTGKELVARALHAGGPRAELPYVVQNCAGMTDTLLQSTLFGHRKGAFTGADRDHRGVFLEADGGTLFLDEVGELSPATQGMLLRALEEGEVTPVGASRPIKVDTRIISATHKDLREEVNAGRFREDLLYRLVVVTVHLPPLRERQGDIALLARHFLDAHCERHGKNVPGLRPDAVAALEAYAWPGNVRELDNEIERIVILAEDGEKIGLAMLSPHIVQGEPKDPSETGTRLNPLLELDDLSYDAAIERLERALIERAIAAEGGSITKAAKRIGIERSRLGKIRKRLRI
jgi:two-component system response regulator HupR/HoxA